MPVSSSTAHTLNNLFSRFASTVAHWAGHPITFGIAVVMLLVWAAFGPLMDYSNGWQLLVNTGTTICTFLMVFVIQNSQNRDGLAAQIKLDEIILSIKGARNAMIDLESLTDEELAELQNRFSTVAQRARVGSGPIAELVEGNVATGTNRNLSGQDESGRQT